MLVLILSVLSLCSCENYLKCIKITGILTGRNLWRLSRPSSLDRTVASTRSDHLCLCLAASSKSQLLWGHMFPLTYWKRSFSYLHGACGCLPLFYWLLLHSIWFHHLCNSPADSPLFFYIVTVLLLTSFLRERRSFICWSFHFLNMAFELRGPKVQ